MPVGWGMSQASLPQDGLHPRTEQSPQSGFQKRDTSKSPAGWVRSDVVAGAGPGRTQRKGGRQHHKWTWSNSRDKGFATRSPRDDTWRYWQLHASPRSFIEFSVFCKCKRASSKHGQHKKVSTHSPWPWPGGSVALQQKAGLAQHRNQQHRACPGPGGRCPPRPPSEMQRWGVGQRTRRSPATGTSASQGAPGKGAGAERCPMGGRTAQSSDTRGLGPTRPCTL